MLEQIKHLSLAIFGYIGFNYDLQTLDGDAGNINELTQALRTIIDFWTTIVYAPKLYSRLLLAFSSKYRRANKTMRHILYEIMENEATGYDQQRKKISFIASLVASLQGDEKVESMKPEEQKKGELIFKETMNIVKDIFWRGFRNLFFWDLFFHGNYLFLEDLLNVSRF
jgi:hypothetical protein